MKQDKKELHQEETKKITSVQELSDDDMDQVVGGLSLRQAPKVETVDIKK